MASANITESMKVLFDHLEKMLQAKTVFGDPITIGDITLIPVVDITFGAGSGGGADKGERGEGAGGGAGAKISAAAVVVVRDGQVQVMKLKHAAALDRLIELVPDLLEGLKKDKPAAEKSGEEK
ncbi:MAG TPA: spore germination protein GerW family protein [Negativicutes bacterium]|nr:spore germination protein GerW family protein [Negativicutes bacterium]